LLRLKGASPQQRKLANPINATISTHVFAFIKQLNGGYVVP
jgi:hypothetical protein